MANLKGRQLDAVAQRAPRLLVQKVNVSQTCLLAQYMPILHLVPVLLPLIHISLTGRFGNADHIYMHMMTLTMMMTRFISVYTVVAVAVERYATLIDFLNKVDP